MHFGFSYIGLLMLLLLLIPNLFWTKHKPLGYDKSAPKENKILLGFERAGEIAVSTLCLIFSDFNIGEPRIWCAWLIVAALLMLLYELYWLRYFRSPQTMADFYSSFCGFPVAGATLPVLAFFALAVYGKNPFLGAAVAVLGIGHIGIHIQHKRELP